MSDHLPECIEYPIPDFNNGVWLCICPALRACERRVLAEREADGPWFRSVVHDCCIDKQTAYAAGLDAAREAVERVSSLLQPLGPALAAIDALRGSGNPYTPPSAEKGEKP